MNVFVTGATAGFGRVLVDKFINRGDFVIATGRRSDRLVELKTKYENKIHVTALDVRKYEDVVKTVQSLPSIDILVNNAGLALGMEGAQKAKQEDWDTMVDTNIKGVLHCTLAILPKMVEQKRGHIVNLGSVAGVYPYPGGNVYGASKAFVH